MYRGWRPWNSRDPEAIFVSSLYMATMYFLWWVCIYPSWPTRLSWNLDFEIVFDHENQHQSIPQTKKDLTKVFAYLVQDWWSWSHRQAWDTRTCTCTCTCTRNDNTRRPKLVSGKKCERWTDRQTRAYIELLGPISKFNLVEKFDGGDQKRRNSVRETVSNKQCILRNGILLFSSVNKKLSIQTVDTQTLVPEVVIRCSKHCLLPVHGYSDSIVMDYSHFVITSPFFQSRVTMTLQSLSTRSDTITCPRLFSIWNHTSHRPSSSQELQ